MGKAKLRSSASDFDHTHPPSTDKRLAWKTVRFPVSVQGLPDFWQICLIAKALQPPKDAYEKLVTPLSKRRLIDTNLVIPPANSIKPSKDWRFRVKFRGAIEQKSGSSFRNTSHAGWCLDKAIAIMKTGARCIPPRGDEKARVLILCLYAEQLLEYKSCIREMVERDISRSLFSSIDLCTLDSSRGKEADIIFVDFVRTEDVGFCDDAYRVCQSLTRSKGHEIILMNESMTFRRRSKRLEYILDHVPNVVTQECYEYCGDHRHTTEDCSRPERCTICGGMEEHPPARCPDTYCPNCRQKGHAVSACAQPRRAQKKPGKRK
ncbi:hypothetical protein F5X68DRAFT_264304 [Plectosphaerella plurivora]|uniref:DNA2/NAM7 helicase-like C-terminal domain-containing protein n=1 Tax=Plectosphaerella plurivora TaxID=936078 RepID=A0A9P8V574_9PEZI|nr:hypothetical protein F5X68DRAFT_264304 [Plectosphaerella plurivora]